MGSGASMHEKDMADDNDEGEIKRLSVSTYLKLAAKIAVNLGKCTKEDLDNEYVKETMKFIEGNPV
jgi:hypothetical protein